MRFKKPYTLVPRRTKCGKIFYRFRVWHPETGKRTELSTGKRSRDAAEKFCEELRSRGALVPTSSPLLTIVSNSVPTLGQQSAGPGRAVASPRPPTTFAKFAAHWWTADCPYSAAEAARGNQLSRTYRVLCEIRLRKQLMPHFGALNLGEITTPDIDRWHLTLKSQPRVANTALSTLQVMLGEAVRLGHIEKNPAKLVKPIAEAKKVRELFTSKEVADLFLSERAKVVWDKDPMACFACRLVSRSGMRAGEVLGLHVGSIDVQPETAWVVVDKSWDRKEVKDTKNHSVRRVPIPEDLATALKAVPHQTGFLFSDDGGKTTITYFRLRKGLVSALDAIGISKVDQKRRGLGLHAFRHWLNTSLRGKVSDDAIRATIGHLSKEMTQHYTHHTLETLEPVANAMREVFNESVEK